MITEVMGFLIIVGTVIVVLVRRKLQKAEEENPVVLEASSKRLREELEQSADEIIARMGVHIDRLERLIREADKKTALLQQQLDASRAVLSALSAQEADSTVSFASTLQKSIAAEAAAEQQTQPVVPMQEAAVGAVAVPTQPTTAVTHEQELPLREAAAVSIDTGVPAQAAVEDMESPEALEADSEAAMLRAQELLQMGCSTEQISKETNLGRGAIELMRQMRRVRK